MLGHVVGLVYFSVKPKYAFFMGCAPAASAAAPVVVAIVVALLLIVITFVGHTI